MDRNNKFLSGVYYDLYHRRKNKTISSQNTDSSGQKTNPDSGSEQLESELKTIIDEFYSKQGISSHQENESKPFMPDEIRAEIEKLIGLNNIKEDIEALMDFCKDTKT